MIEALCRSCGGQESLKNLDACGEEKIEKLLIGKDDALPKFICTECEEDLDFCFHFRQRALETESKLQRILAAINSDKRMRNSDEQNSNEIKDISESSTEDDEVKVFCEDTLNSMPNFAQNPMNDTGKINYSEVIIDNEDGDDRKEFVIDSSTLLNSPYSSIGRLCAFDSLQEARRSIEGGAFNQTDDVTDASNENEDWVSDTSDSEVKEINNVELVEILSSDEEEENVSKLSLRRSEMIEDEYDGSEDYFFLDDDENEFEVAEDENSLKDQNMFEEKHEMNEELDEHPDSERQYADDLQSDMEIQFKSRAKLVSQADADHELAQQQEQQPVSFSKSEEQFNEKRKVESTSDSNEGPVTKKDDGDQEWEPTKRRRVYPQRRINSFTAENDSKNQLGVGSETKVNLSHYTCVTCKRKFENQKDFREHVKTHGNSRYNCTICDKWFSSACRLEMHVKIHENSNENNSCKICHRTYQSIWGLRRHLKTHHLSQQIVCDICKIDFKNQKDLADHSVNVHNSEKKFICPKCFRSFAKNQHLYSHMRVHDPKREKKPDKKKTYYCVHCGKYSKNHLDHRNHYRTHFKDLRFKCDTCERGFSTMAALIAHEYSHVDSRPYQCEHCLMTFRIVDHLREHKKIHLTTLPFNCDYCGAGFDQKFHYTAHLNEHAGEIDRKCLKCEERFTIRALLVKHCMEVHNTPLYEMEKAIEKQKEKTKEEKEEKEPEPEQENEKEKEEEQEQEEEEIPKASIPLKSNESIAANEKSKDHEEPVSVRVGEMNLRRRNPGDRRKIFAKSNF